MGRLESEQGCKKHPSINKLPGVCSNCLKERLSQLNSYSYNNKISYSFYSSPYSSSSSPPPPPYSPSTSSSNFVSPANRRRQHLRNASEVMGSISFMLNSSSSGLKKSRSIAIVAKNQFADFNKDENKRKKKKKSGFWDKLLGTSSGNKTKD